PEAAPIPEALSRKVAGVVSDRAPSAVLSSLDPAVVAAITALTREVVEQIVWEVVPQLAEVLIKEELERVIASRDK
ncbi:MAG: response regulator, partial [Deltaproteobacteria bacterium]|nr:response regulator [Deltaproteobacteria bacterium]